MLLADFKGAVVTGRLDPQTHGPATAKRAILEFVALELCNWRDHPDRPDAHAEDRLTEHLCDHLNTAAYHSKELNHIRFCPEAGDETNANRTVDLAVKPLGASLVVEGRRTSIFETILPIECKRLPTPKATDRDHREYVFSAGKSVGGIQRFKEGRHAANHNLAAMIGYVQRDSCKAWTMRVTQWISDLAASSSPGWSAADLLHVTHESQSKGVTVLSSRHSRTQPLQDIELRHLWVQMN